MDSIIDKEKGFGNYWNTIKQPKTIQVNNSGFFQKPEVENKVIDAFYKIGCEFMSLLIRKAHLISPKSLSLTKDLIRKKQNLSTRIKNTSEQIQKHCLEQ